MQGGFSFQFEMVCDSRSRPLASNRDIRRGVGHSAKTLAQAVPASLRVLHVTTTRDKGAEGDASRAHGREEGILRETGALAARYDVGITATLRAHTAPESAILQEIASTDVDLVVMGVDRIQAEHLSFGGVADAVLRQAKVSVLLVSSNGSDRPPGKAS